MFASERPIYIPEIYFFTAQFEIFQSKAVAVGKLLVPYAHDWAVRFGRLLVHVWRSRIHHELVVFPRNVLEDVRVKKIEKSFGNDFGREYTMLDQAGYLLLSWIDGLGVGLWLRDHLYHELGDSLQFFQLFITFMEIVACYEWLKECAERFCRLWICCSFIWKCLWFLIIYIIIARGKEYFNNSSVELFWNIRERKKYGACIYFDV